MLTPSQLLQLDPETLEIVTSARDPEAARKLAYLSEQLLDPERADDREFLQKVKRDVIRQYGRRR